MQNLILISLFLWKNGYFYVSSISEVVKNNSKMGRISVKEICVVVRPEW
jgi:hypothetical protein